MRIFNNLSIKNKLIGIIFLVSMLAIVTGFTFIIIKDIKSFKTNMVDNTTVNAKLIGEYCVTPLAFQDNAGAEEILGRLETIPSIMNGYVYDDKGDLFAVFNRYEETNVPPLPTKEETSSVFEGKYLHLFQPILYQNQKYGTIYLRASTYLLVDKIKRYLLTMVLLMMGLMVLSYFLASKLQSIISKPIITLTDITNKISEKGDYSFRVEKRVMYRKGYNEITILYNRFDNMLNQIHIREIQRDKAEEELRKHREHLEELVKERTIELEKKTEEIEQANIQLKELDRLKSMFIASMSHELRTPLNSIIGFTGIILQGIAGELTEEQRKQLTMVKNSANHLLALINDIIDVSKIEADKVELFIEEFDLSYLLQEVKDSLTIAVEKKDLEMSLMMPEKLVIKSDERRVKQIIVNLAGNAVKFTDEGKIEIKAVKNDGKVEVSVRDTGFGMRKEDLDRLFKAFSRILVEDRTVEGTGLGLYLSKKIANLLGGDILAESEFGKGSEFTFTLPLKYKEVKT